ncbi:butyrophilin subfamily 1 member A1-like [Lepisosteus oculatus]|uniref:butyrophilin subfamily 1 member A1-like n=1 Tax=Lepisosteus oculatus TaxID=7918 RepID=UPI0035F50377
MRIFLILLILMTFPQVPSDPVLVSGPYGDSVTLPCDGRAAAQIPEDQLHVQWKTPDRPVLDVISGTLYPDPDYKGRAEVSREKIGQGDFSLTINHTIFSDEAVYECSYKGEDDLMKFLNDIKVTLTVRRENRSAAAGADVSLPVFAREPVEVLFNDTEVYPRGTVPGQHVSVRNGTLTIHRVTPAHQGIYTVRDETTRRTISSIRITIKAPDDEDASHQQDDSDQGDRSTAVIAGVLGAVIGLAVAAGVGIWRCRRRRRNP